MAFALACTQMKLLPEEAFNALTYNAAFALEMQQELGSIQKGKLAHLIITSEQANGLEDLAYWFGRNLIDKVVIG